ncbi:MAG TPA: integrin alpha [Candidatus Binatia bacterium]|nr:integrin alpha [Candidatus Binatia bacterium]
MRRRSAGRFLLSFGVLGAVFWPRPSVAVEVICRNGDALGWSVATGGDFDGDGVTDVAAGAPCARANKQNRAGRAYVYSGATGERLLSIHGNDVEQQLGSAIAFLDDVDGDGRDDVAVGSSTFDAPRPGLTTTFNAAGKLEVYSSKGGIAWTLHGTNPQANLGESVDGLPDIDGDSIGDVVVGASGASVDLGEMGVDRAGIGYLVSGADGTIIEESRGFHITNAWANVVARVGDVDDDGNDDIAIAASNAEVFPEGGPAGGTSTTTFPETTTTLIDTTTTLPDTTTSTIATTTTTTTTMTTTSTLRDAGIVQILSGVFPYPEIKRITGGDRQRLGRAVDGTIDLDGDGPEDLWLGAPGTTVSTLADAGRIVLDRSTLSDLTIAEPNPQGGAAFGTALVVVGNINNDAIPDVAASAPTANVNNGAQTGRVHAYSGTGLSLVPLWTRNGPVGRARMGQSMDAGIFYNADAIPDLVVGIPGDAPRGRRNAGSVHVLDGATGQTLEQFNGRRGGESRIFVAGPGVGGRPVIRAFDLRGRRREADIGAFREQEAVHLSLAVIDDTISTGPDDMLLAVGSGPGGSNRVTVYRAGRRRSRVSSFAPVAQPYTGGVNVAAGNLFLDLGAEDLLEDVEDEIAAVPADASSGNIDVVVRQRSDVDEFGNAVWTQVRTFRAISATDKFDGDFINAVGGHVVSGNVLTDETKDELVVAPARGLPIVRVFNRNGTLEHTFEAFEAEGTDGLPNSGVALALGNLDGDESNIPEIVTAVADGQLRVKAFRGNGTAVPQFINGPPVNFTVFYPNGFRGGLRVATADVDFDDAAEILVAPASGIAGPILAYELNGAQVAGWKPFFPLGPGVDTGLNLVATDSFVRR